MSARRRRCSARTSPASPGQGPPQLRNGPLRGRLRRAGTRQQGPRADAQGADGRVHARAAALDALARENAHHPRRRRLRPARVSHRAPPEARSRAGRLQRPKQTSAARGHAPDQGADRTHHDEPLAGSADPSAQPSPPGLDQLPPSRREYALLRLSQPLPVVASGALAAQEAPASDLETDQAAVLATHVERRQRREARLARRGRSDPLPLPGSPHPLAVERHANKPGPPNGRGRSCLTSHQERTAHVLWRAGCGGTRTSGSEGGSGETGSPKADTALRCRPLPVETLWLGRLYVLFFLELGTRRVHFAGCTANPDGRWTAQQARQLVWSLSGRATPARFLIHDRDSKFSRAFDDVFRSES